jgi:NDP-sugar pyrophosphorylase family protein
MKQKISITLNERLLKGVDSIVDNVFIRNRSQAIEYLVMQSLGDQKTAVLLAGGPEDNIRIGKGYSPTTMVDGVTVVELAARKLREHGFKRIFVDARHKVLTAIFSVLGDGALFGVSVSYVEEKESDGTARTLKLLRGKVYGSFLVVYGDIIFSGINLESIWEDHLKQNGVATLMLTTSSRPSEKGTVVMEGNKVLSFTQKPKHSDQYLVFSPLFVASDDILEVPGGSLEKQVFPELAKRGLLFGHLSSKKEIHIHNKEDTRKDG